MPIPAFDGILNVLPPHLGNPTGLSGSSPYGATIIELCEQFATTERRKKILSGFLDLRKELITRKLCGFQWIDGSFLENIEVQEERDPNDIDVVTFVANPINRDEVYAIIPPSDELLNPKTTKEKYHVDHYLLPLGSEPKILVHLTRYWYGLFSHRRDGVWKGILEIPLEDSSMEEEAKALLSRVCS